MRVLVTGASGFLGSHFVQTASSHGHDVVAAVRRPEPRVSASQRIMDVFDPRPDDLADIQAIVHFAAATGGTAEEFYRLNAQGSLRLFEAAQRAGVKRFIHVSSVSIYGSDGGIEGRPRQRGPYAGSKSEADLLIRNAALGHESAVRTSVLRPGLVYGPGMRASVLAGAAVITPGRTLLGIGPRAAHLPIVHVDDLSAVIAATLEHEVRDPLEVWDVLSPVLPSRDQMVKLFADLTGGNWTVIWIPSLVLVGFGFVAALGQAARGKPRGLVHRLRRATKFDAGRLNSVGIWKAKAVQPMKDTRQCLLDGLLADQEAFSDRLVGGVNETPSRLAEIGQGLPQPGDRKRLIVVGAGRVVRELHMPVLLRSDHWQVVAVIDPNISAASEIAARLGAIAAQSLDDIDELQLAGATIVIATPGANHSALAQIALQRGTDVIVEKPVSTTRIEFETLREAARGKVVTAIQNYRLRPNVRKLWQAMAKGNAGPIRRIAVEYHSGRLSMERASWMRHDEFGRTVLSELAIHFLDLACVAVGQIDFPKEAVVASLGRDGALVRLSALGTSTTGDVPVGLSVSVAGTAQRCHLTFEFERATYELNFFPEGFRVLPIRSTPVDDLTASVGRTLRYTLDRSPFGVRNRSGDSPHALIYRDHLARTTMAPQTVQLSAFSLAGVADTMETLFGLQEVLSARAPLTSI